MRLSAKKDKKKKCGLNDEEELNKKQNKLKRKQKFKYYFPRK